MTLPQGYTFATASNEDREEIVDLDLWAFPSATTNESALKRPQPYANERSVLVRNRDGQLAAFHTSYEFSHFNVPGAAIPVAGLTWVGVHPSARRQGLLRAMIQRHFADCLERGESVSALFAAEPGIYGRFGYGRASHDVRFTLGRGVAQRELAKELDPQDSGLTVRIEKYSRQEHEGIIESLHIAAGRNVNGTGLNRPGWATRDTQALRDESHTVIDENPTRESLRIVIVERDGVAVGYARFRRTLSWEPTGPNGQVHAGEVVAVDAAASRKLWSVLADFDLTGSVSAFMVPTDDPLLGRLENTRSIKMHHVDNVWTRIVDLKKALEARQYASDVEVVLEVSDAMVPANAGKWKLSAAGFDGPSGSRTPVVERTDAPADITIDIRELSTVYLGGPTLASLAAAGLITASSPRALASASVAFGWPHAPMSSWVF